MPRKKTTTEKPAETGYSKKRLQAMVKQNNLEDVSLITKVLNSVDILVTDEVTGEIIDKDKTIEHFIVLKDFKNSEYMENFKDILKTRKSKSKNDEILEGQLEALPGESEEEADFNLDAGDKTVYLPKDEMTMLIAKELKISESSLTILTNPGWYIIPIYAGQTEFRPIFFESTKNSTVLVMKKEPIFTLSKTPFPKNAPANTWQYNSCPILNQIFDKIGAGDRFLAYAPIKHFRDKNNVRALKVATRMFENVQKARIKIGNNIISNIYVQHGNIGFNELKLEQAKIEFPELFNDELYTKDGGEISDEIKEEREKKLKKIKILDCVAREYEYLQNYMRSISGIPKEILKAVRTMDKLGKSEEEIILKIGKKIEVNPFSSYIRTEDRFNEILKILKDGGNELRFLTTYDIYNQTREWMNYGAIEEETKMYAEMLVEAHPVWIHFLQGVIGVGKQLAAQLIAGFDFYRAEHPSSFLKYIGLDQIPIKPVEKEITREMQVDAINLVIESYKRASNMAERTGDEINKETFATFATDGIETYKDWQIVENWYVNAGFSDLDSPARTQTKIESNLSKWFAKYPDIERIVEAVCKNYVVKANVDMEGLKYINKRARTKKDRQKATYRTADNKVAVKDYLGYNSALKGIVMGRVFSSFLKAGSKSHYENIYRDYSARLAERPDIKQQQINYDNKVEGARKPHIHNMARRKVCQLFIQDLFMNGVRALNLPDNGGTYEEAKLGIHHHQNVATPTYLKDPSEFKTNKEYEKYLKENMY